MVFTDNKDFYPTPRELYERLVGSDRRFINGRILEPSAGKGDLIRHITDNGQRRYIKVDAIESDPRLSSILMGDGHSVVWDDFLTYETYKEYDHIIMNPPFSNGVDHVLKALDMADAQITPCSVYAILNKETINNAYSDKRQELLRRLNDHGAEIVYVKDAFTEAERKTDVEVALIRCRVAKEGKGRSIYDSIPFTSTRESEDQALTSALSTYVKPSELQAKLNEIERLVLEYETACELARDTYEAVKAKESFFTYISQVNRREDETVSPLYNITINDAKAGDLSEELDRLRRGYWELILDTKEFRELLTNEAIQKLNRQMSVANDMEINVTNIHMLLMALSTNQRNILIDSVVSIFERITKYHMNDFSSNIHYYDGWKTNNAYKINKKIIIPIKGEFDHWDIKDDYSSINTDARNWIDDIIKAFRLIDDTVGGEFEHIGNNSFENDLLRFRMFYNGNIHVWFKDERLLAKLNYLCGSHFGWIPSEDEQKTDKKAREWVAKEFGDIGEVALLQA